MLLGSLNSQSNNHNQVNLLASSACPAFSQSDNKSQLKNSAPKVATWANMIELKQRDGSKGSNGPKNLV